MIGSKDLDVIDEQLAAAIGIEVLAGIGKVCQFRERCPQEMIASLQRHSHDLLAASLVALLIPSMCTVLCGQVVTPQYTAPILKTAPQIDGSIDEKEWGDALRVVAFETSAFKGAGQGQAIGHRLIPARTRMKSL